MDDFQCVTAEPMMLLPPADGHCRICAVKHGPEEPHNAQSLFFQMRFKMRYKRDGTWADAIAHLSPKKQEIAKIFLQKTKAWTEPPMGMTPVSEPIDG